MKKMNMSFNICKKLHRLIGYTFLYGFDSHVATISKRSIKKLIELDRLLCDIEDGQRILKNSIIGAEPYPHAKGYAIIRPIQLKYNKITESIISEIKDPTFLLMKLKHCIVKDLNKYKQYQPDPSILIKNYLNSHRLNG